LRGKRRLAYRCASALLVIAVSKKFGLGVDIKAWPLEAANEIPWHVAQQREGRTLYGTVRPPASAAGTYPQLPDRQIVAGVIAIGAGPSVGSPALAIDP
jgi:hypothetical protein